VPDRLRAPLNAARTGLPGHERALFPLHPAISTLVVGAGYLGLATALGLTSRGYHVRLVERRQDRRAQLRSGRVPVAEPGMQEALEEALARGAIDIADRPDTESSDVVFICVATPGDASGTSDLSQVQSALEDVAPQLGSGAVLVIRSTLPVGSTARILDWSEAPPNRTFVNPEFLRQGHALDDFLHPTRVVVGCLADPDPAALALLEAILRVDSVPFLVVTATEADLIKNGANAFLALKLSFANELALLCELLDADVGPVLRGIGLDPRIGSTHLSPSFGFGGSCLPKDVRALARAGIDRALPMQLSSAADEANQSHQARFAERIEVLLGTLPGRKIGLLGLAFKAGTDDVRESPAVRLARRLIAGGAAVSGYDPLAGPNARAELPELDVVDSAEEALRGADLAVVGTEWPEFRDLPWDHLRGLMAVPRILDGRRLLDERALRDRGFAYERIGAPGVPVSAAASAWDVVELSVAKLRNGPSSGPFGLASLRAANSREDGP